ncbi:MAG TPA: energy-coupling factor transporter transmembrane component T [Candidatus Limnocylindrales bacterium]|nr:energy-coupling factor transporter transmembrane component T [Candidatus Limnocylindrales bacterium]
MTAAAGPATRDRLPDFVRRPPSGRYRSLSPATKLVAGLAQAVVAFTLGSWSGPLLVLGLVLATAAAAGVLRPLARVAAVTLPILASMVVINGLLFPGATDVVARIGPLAPSPSGVLFGAQAATRLLAMSLALALVYLTTEVDDLLADLERRGLGRRAAFVVGAALDTVPRMVERAGEIVDAQRSRGLDTQGRFWRRARGVVPLAAPLIFGALNEVEERTLALEARAFSAPVRRTALRTLVELPAERWARWLLAAAALGATALRLAGPAAMLP